MKSSISPHVPERGGTRTRRVPPRLITPLELEPLHTRPLKPPQEILDAVFRLSPWAFIFGGEGCVAAWHSLNQSLVYGDERLERLFNYGKQEQPSVLRTYREILGEGDTALEDLAMLIENDLLIPARADADAPLRAICHGQVRHRPQIGILYLLVTNDCNLRCRYCSIESEDRKPADFQYSRMPVEMAQRAVDLFFDILDEHAREPTIIYYGGEPLLNFETLIESARYIRDKRKVRKHAYLEPQLSAVLNGTLITDQIARQLKDLGVNASVSIDGLKRHHNRMRRYRGGGGTWDDAVRGYMILKKHTGGGSISCTLGPHNCDDVEEIAEFFATRLECQGMGFNIMKGLPSGNRLELPAEKVTRRIIDAYEIFRRYGVYEDRIMRKITAFASRTAWLYDCGGYGGQIALCADGSLGPCHIAADDRRFTWGSIYDRDIRSKVQSSALSSQWCRRTPVFMKECLTCEVLALCGGGCAEEAFMKHGDINAMDDSFCDHAKMILRWLIDDTAKTLRGRGRLLQGGILR